MYISVLVTLQDSENCEERRVLEMRMLIDFICEEYI
jgi:hypothetical protein